MLNRMSTLAVITVFCLHTLAFAHGEKPHVMGTVAAVDAQHVVVQTREGKTLSILLNTATKYRKGEAGATWAELKVGDRVVVDTTGEGDTLRASEIRFASPGGEKGHGGHEGHEGMPHRPTAP